MPNKRQVSKAGGRTSFVAAFDKIMEVLNTVNVDHRAAEISIVFMTDGDDTCHRKVPVTFNLELEGYHIFIATNHNLQ